MFDAKQWAAAYYRDHVVSIKARARAWTIANPDKRHVIVRGHYARRRQAALEKLGGKCAGCGWTDVRALQIDHVHSDGHSDRKLHAGAAFFKYVVEVGYATGRYQVLCANCNCIKAYELLECRRRLGKGKLQCPMPQQ